MADFIVAGILLIILGFAIVYIVKARKSGVKCIGCSAGGSCSSKEHGHSKCSCGCHSEP